MTTRSSSPDSTTVASRACRDGRRPGGAAVAPERVRGGPAGPAIGAQRCSRRPTVARSTCGNAAKWVARIDPEGLDRAREPLRRQRVDRVLHGVGRDHQGVVAGRVGGREVTLERDVHGEVANPVAARIPDHLDEPDRPLAVPVRAELDHGVLRVPPGVGQGCGSPARHVKGTAGRRGTPRRGGGLRRAVCLKRAVSLRRAGELPIVRHIAPADGMRGVRRVPGRPAAAQRLGQPGNRPGSVVRCDRVQRRQPAPPRHRRAGDRPGGERRRGSGWSPRARARSPCAGPASPRRRAA